MQLDNDQRKDLRRIAHHLKPIVIVAERGLTASVMAEIERALLDHELIKVRITANDRAERSASVAQICEERDAALVAEIGKIAVLYRRNAAAKPHLSNLQRPAPGVASAIAPLPAAAKVRASSAKSTKAKTRPAKARAAKKKSPSKPPRILRPR